MEWALLGSSFAINRTLVMTDAQRRHGLNEAIDEYQRLLNLYPSLGYDVTILPKVSVHERADLVLHTLAE